MAVEKNETFKLSIDDIMNNPQLQNVVVSFQSLIIKETIGQGMSTFRYQLEIFTDSLKSHD